MAIPPDVAKHISAPLKQIMNLREVCLPCICLFVSTELMPKKHCRTQVRAVKVLMDSGSKMDKPTIFPALLAPPPGIPAPTIDQIKDEAYSILAAAADTTGNAMTVAAYNVVNNPEIYRRLCEELAEAFPDPNGILDYATLEKLPYLVSFQCFFRRMNYL